MSNNCRKKLFIRNNIKFDSQGYYAYIGVFDNKDYEEFSLIVDTNIAKDIILGFTFKSWSSANV